MSFAVAALLLLAVAAPYAFAQESSDVSAGDAVDNSLLVVINEIEINPHGNDGLNTFEWVELYNPTDEIIPISGWSVSSHAAQLSAVVPNNVVLRPDQYFTFTRGGEWFFNIAESAVLKNAEGVIIDRTPLLIDTDDDLNTWHRIYDALDTDENSDWEFGVYSRGYSNGKPAVADSRESIAIHVVTDKETYVQGETVMISGQISGINVDATSFFIPAYVHLGINGTDYTSNILLTPDPDLSFSSRIPLRESTGTGIGSYDVVATYVGSTAATSFTVADLSDDTVEGIVDVSVLSVRTDKDSYLPGDTVVVLARSDLIFDLEGLTFEIYDPRGTVISQGILFPSERSHSTALRTIGEDVAGNAQFATSVFLDTVSPEYGAYSINVKYGDLDAVNAFLLEQDILDDDVAVSIATDKRVYALGETVRIDGRINDAWRDALSLTVEHLQNLVVIPSGSAITSFRIAESLTPEPDGRFSYEFDIPEESYRAGRYNVSLSANSFETALSFEAVSDTTTYTADLFNVNVDKESYIMGEKFEVRGRLAAVDPLFHASSVIARIVPSDDLRSIGLLLSAAPDSSGSYRMTNVIERGLFEPGSYTLTASYLRGTEEGLLGDADLVGTYRSKYIHEVPAHVASTTFEVTDPRDLGGAHFEVSIENDSYSFGQTVKISGIVTADLDINSLTIFLLKPDGTRSSSSVTVNDDGTFEWGWQTPSVKTDINTGVYTITVSSDSTSEDLMFRIGDRAPAATSQTPITLEISENSFEHGQTMSVSGTVLRDNVITTFQPVSEPVNVFITRVSAPLSKIADYHILPSTDGLYGIDVKITPGVYEHDAYMVNVAYKRDRTSGVFYVGEIPNTIRADTAQLREQEVEAIPVPTPKRIVDEQDLQGPSAMISIAQREINNVTFLARSLGATVDAQSSGASLRLSYGDTCVVGNSGCLIEGSTRTSGSLYKTVSAGGTDFDVRYSGADADPVRLTVIPSERNSSIPDSEWTLEAVDSGDATPSYRVLYTPSN